MKLKWLKQSIDDESDRKLIFFFGGWGLGDQVVEHLMFDEFDVLFLNDYRNLSFYFSLNESIIFERYQERILVAWSFGVAAASSWVANSFAFTFDRKIAINGTMQAVDRYLGIPEAIVKKTKDTLSNESFKLFAQRCFGNEDMMFELTAINIDACGEELDVFLNSETIEINGWDTVWLSRNDEIFPANNMLKSWHQYNQQKNMNEQATIYTIDAPHAPFRQWKRWREIVV